MTSSQEMMSIAGTQILRNALKGGVWRAVWCGLVGALIVILARSGIDLKGLFKGLFERLTTP
jgi:hypothetical protein